MDVSVFVLSSTPFPDWNLNYLLQSCVSGRTRLGIHFKAPPLDGQSTSSHPNPKLSQRHSRKGSGMFSKIHSRKDILKQGTLFNASSSRGVIATQMQDQYLILFRFFLPFSEK